MKSLSRWTAVTVMVSLVFAWSEAAQAEDWSEPVVVLHEHQECVSYRAGLNGDLLVVQASVQSPWHTFVMDNKQRAAEKLAGRPSIGIDLPTEIKVTKGLEVIAPWYQSRPRDFSQPAMRWFSWGYEGQALFVTKVKRSGTGPAQIEIRGQACTDSMCKNIDVDITLPLADATTALVAAPDLDLKSLVPVRD